MQLGGKAHRCCRKCSLAVPADTEPLALEDHGEHSAAYTPVSSDREPRGTTPLQTHVLII